MNSEEILEEIFYLLSLDVIPEEVYEMIVEYGEARVVEEASDE